MPLPDPKAGLVVCHSYLWGNDHKNGREEGDKDRPCVILACRDVAGGSRVMILPVTHTEPSQADKRFAVEIPRATKVRMGLDDAPSWIICKEGNEFAWPGTDLRRIARGSQKFDYGFLPPGIFAAAKEKAFELIRSRQFQIVPRLPDLKP